MARFLLLHSPLVGPRTLSPLAYALNDLGHSAAVPDLRAAVSPNGPDHSILRALARQALLDTQPQEPLIICTHSGAGHYLPIVAPAVQPQGLALIDAVLPPQSGTVTPSAEFRAELDGLVEADGHLPPWSQWWGEHELARLLPDADLRAAIREECPRLPLSFYDAVLEVPDGWARPWASYLRLSEAYEATAVAAAARSWPVRRRDGSHLDTATHPYQVAGDLMELVRPILDTHK
ncbi:hypothetical protein BH24ACT9_BH24ACT9_01400 [soil metagenome]